MPLHQFQVGVELAVRSIRFFETAEDPSNSAHATDSNMSPVDVVVRRARGKETKVARRGHVRFLEGTMP